jgi:AraC-like DNA-binding protein
MLFTSLILVFIVSTLFLINHWTQNKGVIYLVFVIIGLSLRQFSILVLNTSRDPTVLASLAVNLDPLLVLMGPLLIYYFKSIIKGAFVWDKYLLVYSIPSLIVFINLIPYFMLPFQKKMDFFKHNFTNQHDIAHLFLPWNYQFSLVIIYNLGCLIYGILFLIKVKNTNGIYVKKKVTILINRILAALSFIIVPNLILMILLTSKSKEFGNIDFLNPEALNINSLYFLTLLLPLSFFFIPSWLYNEREPLSFLDNFNLTWKRVISTNSNFSDEETPEKSTDLDRILLYIETEKPYVLTAFSLHDISHALNIPHTRVTHSFNKQLKVPFPAYRNKLRIDYAITLLRSGAHLTTSIEGVAEMSGFKSKSIFYKTFKEEHGTTPIEWIRSNL